MLTAFWVGLVLKMAASAVVVVGASLIVERSGPFLGAMVATLPISAGPAYVVLALDHDASFFVDSTKLSLSINAATIAYLAIYTLLARRHGLIACLVIGLGLWFLAAFAILRFEIGFSGAVVMNVAVFAAAFLVLSRAGEGAAAPRKPPPRWWDIPFRAAAVVASVAAVVVTGRALGPEIAGIAALIPVGMTSLAIILHPRLGGPATSTVFVHALPGMIGFTIAIMALHLLAAPMGPAFALTSALAICVLWNGALILYRTVRMRRAAATSG